MAQYYERRYKIASENAQLRSRSQQTPIAPEEDEDGSIHESFYIFPSPSGPSCPTNPSIYFPDYSPSMATTLSPSSEISSVDGSSLPTPIVLTPMEGTEGQIAGSGR
ncbi:hypothetical protein NMY22_g19413 [Coprinellus aureogranulatus]|nr:hypothetical protein NMY22_g19413 [Coprinellus aureogranulatus]